MGRVGKEDTEEKVREMVGMGRAKETRKRKREKGTNASEAKNNETRLLVIT